MVNFPTQKKYLSPSTKHFFSDPDHFGCMFNIVYPIGKQQKALEAGCYWMLDNGQFKDKWTWKLWWKYLSRYLSFQSTCLGVVIPDKLADYVTTIHYFKVYSHIARDMGYPVALVTQDGLKPEYLDWQSFDTLFVGGSNDHKRGVEAHNIIFEAKRHGKWVHIGRVQSGSAMLKHWPMADSFDGTTLVRNQNQQWESIIGGLDKVESPVYFNLKMF